MSGHSNSLGGWACVSIKDQDSLIEKLNNLIEQSTHTQNIPSKLIPPWYSDFQPNEYQLL